MARPCWPHVGGLQALHGAAAEARGGPCSACSRSGAPRSYVGVAAHEVVARAPLRRRAARRSASPGRVAGTAVAARPAADPRAGRGGSSRRSRDRSRTSRRPGSGSPGGRGARRICAMPSASRPCRVPQSAAPPADRRQGRRPTGGEASGAADPVHRALDRGTWGVHGVPSGRHRDFAGVRRGGAVEIDGRPLVGLAGLLLEVRAAPGPGRPCACAGNSRRPPWGCTRSARSR